MPHFEAQIFFNLPTWADFRVLHPFLTHIFWNFKAVKNLSGFVIFGHSGPFGYFWPILAILAIFALAALKFFISVENVFHFWILHPRIGLGAKFGLILEWLHFWIFWLHRSSS